MKKIGIITYDHPHRKTMDVLAGLLLHGVKFEQITLLVQPWKIMPKKQPLYPHRPDPIFNADLVHLVTTTGMKVVPYSEDVLYITEVIEELDIVLIAGAGILEKVNDIKTPIINSHPGYLPNVRGLDALKWAIYTGQPIGVTLHYINRHLEISRPHDDMASKSYVDTGMIIERRFTDFYFEDSFHSLAQRVYEMEVRMLVLSALNDHLKPDSSQPIGNEYPLRGRMPVYLEPIMIQKFEHRRKAMDSKYK